MGRKANDVETDCISAHCDLEMNMEYKMILFTQATKI